MTTENQYWGVKEKLYSKIQYFFWLLSGSEISILKECPTEYNRHAGIGFTIFMTCLFGTFSGGYAGYYFSKAPSTDGIDRFDSNAILPAIIFGIIWGMLIFSIDRSMVISLKKDPTKRQQSFWAPLISRAILGGLIAFIISIPLEIKVFEESINSNMSKYKTDKISEMKKKKMEVNDIQKTTNDLSIAEKKKADIEILLSMNEPNSLEYKTKKSELEYNQAKEKSLNSDLQKAKQDAKTYLNKRVPLISISDGINPKNTIKTPDKSSKEYTKGYIPLCNKVNGIQVAIDSQNKITKQIENEKKDIRDKWIAEKNSERINADTLVNNLQKKKNVGEKNVGDAVTNLDGILEFQKGFILRYEVLNSTASQDPAILFFVWLIRILFFVIEILPTVVKLSTPLGQYDWAVYKKEKDFVEIYLPSKSKEFEEDIEKKKQNKRENEEYKNKKEEELYKITVDKVADVQNKIALTILKEYEEKTMNNIPKNIDNFLDNNN